MRPGDAGTQPVEDRGGGWDLGLVEAFAYGAGLRVSEVARLEVGDIDAKRPFGGAEQVIRYLGRYTHRVGISNRRLVSMDDRGITFRTKDGKTATLSPDAFLGRFLQHVLPGGFVKIRHYGLMAASNVTTKLERARALLAATAACRAAPPVVGPEDDEEDFEAVLMALRGIDLRRCPACHELTLVRQPLPGPQSRAPPVAA